MNSESKIQLEEQAKRWDSRADDWDEEIQKQDHYANFENGYQKFLDFEKRELAQIEKAEVGIDIGCGSGVTAVILAENVEKIYLLDLAEKMLEQAKQKVPSAIALHASATKIPLESQSVDIAISRGIVISHLPKGMQESFLDELERIVKPGGKIIIDFLANAESVDFKNASPKVSFSKEQIQTELKNRNFENIIFDGENENRVVRVSAIKQ